MNVRLIFGFAMSVLFLNGGGTAAAASLPQRLKDVMKTMSAHAPAGRKTRSTKLKAGDCPSFNGHWKGTCNDGTDVSTDEQLITQDDCDVFIFSGRELKFGGASQETASDPNGAWLNLSLFPDWDAARTGIVLKFNVAQRGVGEDFYGNGRGRVTFTLLEGKLVTQQKTDYQAEIGGTVFQDSYVQECTYDKQPE